MPEADSRPSDTTRSDSEADGPTPRDSIDRLLASWARQRPDLDFSPVGIVTRLNRVRAYVDAELERVFGRYGLSAANFAVLVTLARLDAEDGVSQRRLMDELRLTSGTISVRIDRLVAEGLVDRRVDPDSRRTSRIRLTDRGRELFERVAPAHLDNERRMLSALTDAERETLAGLLRKLLVEFEGSGPLPGRTPSLGVSLAAAHTAMAMRASVGLPALPAPLVRAVAQDSPAARAGIRPGDLLMAAGGRPLRSVADVHVALAAAGPGRRIGVRLLRGTSQLELQVALDAGAGPGEATSAQSGSPGGDHFA